ncbi:MAG: methyltransferase [Desulfobacteraceae bacterium]|nr:methyltransferase [Desulfobacteraceae bacterium]
MTYIDRHRFSNMAEDYDAMVCYLLPKYGDFQDEMIKISGMASAEKPIVMDLGGGSGRFLEKLLTLNPTVTAYWVDSSEDFLSVAKKRLASFGEQVTFISSPLEERWEQKIEQPVDAVFSMSAIHHLESGEKRDLYKRCFDLLRPMGWFLNTDEMITIHQDSYIASMLYWVNHVIEAKDDIPEDMHELYEDWQGHFAKWKQRNIDEVHLPKKKGDDLHESFMEQIKWLRKIGYTNVDLYVKHHLWSMIGGQKKS